MEEYSKFEEVLAQQGVLFYTNTGDSMMPLLRQHRDVLVIKPKPSGRLRRLDIAFYKRDNGGYVLHRVLWVRKNDYLICGDNRWYVERGIADRHILGVLDAVVRDGRTIPLCSTPEHPKVPFRYRLYQHLWCDFFPIRAIILFVKSRWKTSVPFGPLAPGYSGAAFQAEIISKC